MCAAGRVAISTTYMNELVLEKKRAFVTTCLCVLDAFVLIFQVIYYSIDRNVYPLHWFMLCVNCFLTLCLILLPESAKWQYARNKFDDARKSLYKIAYFNRADNLHLIKEICFDTENMQKDGGDDGNFMANKNYLKGLRGVDDSKVDEDQQAT